MDSALWNTAVDVAALATPNTGAVLVKGLASRLVDEDSVETAADKLGVAY